MTGAPSSYFSSIVNSGMPERTSDQLKPRIYPSRSSTSRTLLRSFEAGHITARSPADCAFRMRASISPMGSLIAISRIPPLPTRLDHAGDLPGRGQLAQRDARQLELPIVRPRAAGELATQADPVRRRVPRQLGELQARREPVLDRQRLVVRHCLQPRALGGELLRQLHAALVLFDRALLRHLVGPPPVNS